MKPTAKSPEESRIISRRIVMPEQINPNGTLFGGVLMSWIDKTALMTAQRHCERERVVTANIDQIMFHEPLKTGEHVLLNSVIEYVGRSSMEIAVLVAREGLKRQPIKAVAEAFLTFVALDAEGRSIEVPRLALLHPESIERYQRARIRKKIRERIAAWMSRKALPASTSGDFSDGKKKLA